MSNKELPDISVSDFAMDILNTMAKNPKKSLKPALKESTLGNDRAPDISNIDVSDDFVSLVTEGRKPKQVPVSQPLKESSVDKMQNLVEKLSGLVLEAKQLILEITSVGNIGTGSSKSNRPKKLIKDRIKSKYCTK